MQTTQEDLPHLRERIRAKRELPPPSVCRALREGAGISQGDIARVLGITRGAVYNWEAGLRKPSSKHLVAYAEILRAIAGGD